MTFAFHIPLLLLADYKATLNRANVFSLKLPIRKSIIDFTHNVHILLIPRLTPILMLEKALAVNNQEHVSSVPEMRFLLLSGAADQ